MFVLDTDIFIGMKDRAGMGAPAFSSILINQAQNGNITSIDHVQDELLKRNDLLAQWAKTKFAFAFSPTKKDHQVIACHNSITNWADNKMQHNKLQYMPKARKDLKENADGWLVAYAKVRGVTVATNETSHPDSRSNIYIPDICRKFKVKCVNQQQMAQKLGIQLP